MVVRIYESIWTTYISVSAKGSHELFDHFEFSTEEGILVLFQLVVVHAKKLQIDAGDSLNQAFVGGRQLEFPEKASADTSGGGAGQTDLEIPIQYILRREIDLKSLKWKEMFHRWKIWKCANLHNRAG